MVKTTKNEVVHARINPQLKEKVENILAQLGLTTSDAVNLFFKQIELNNGLPFQLKIPRINSETIASIAEAKKIAADKDTAGFNDLNLLWDALRDEH